MSMMMRSSKPQDKAHAGRGTNLAHGWPGNWPNANNKKFPSDSMPGTPSEPAGTPNPTIRITEADGLSLREQSPENPHEVPGCEQSQGSYSILDSEDCRSVYTPSEDLDPTEEAYYHGLDKDGWHEGGQDALELKKSMEKSLEELALISSNRINAGGDINPAQVAPFRDQNGGLPALRREETHNVTGGRGELDLGRRVNFEGGLGQSPHLHITPPHEHPKEPLEDRLLDALVNNDTTWGFFPVNSLPDIITESTVKEELQKHFKPAMKDWDGISRYARKICGTSSSTTASFRKIFAILVMIGKTPAIFKFVDEKVNDFDLPLTACYVPSKQVQISEFRRSRGRYTGVRVECFREGWNKIEMKSFEQWQWRTLAPIFEQSDEDKSVSHYFSPTGKITLPFIHDSGIVGRRAEEFEGGGGRVTKVRIHPDHHSFHYKNCPRHNSATAVSKSSDTTPPSRGRDCECRFAIKQLHSTDEAFQQFKKEVDVLRRFSNEKNNHLISLLATYEHNDDFYLIFPWAQATLKTYWEEKHPNPSLDKQTVLWVAEQCKGIAYGVLAIHQYRSGKWSKTELDPTAGQNVQFGHHGDIKPENILWFQDSHETNAGSQGFHRGTLKLTDFGLAAINTNRTVSRQLLGFPCSRSYCAPEAELLNCGGPGRQYDMWTLGCLYLEFITWMMGGWKLVKNFERARSTMDPRWAWKDIKTDTFFEVKAEGDVSGQVSMKAEVKPQVTKFIERLHYDPRCTNFVHDFLNMIQTGLLIVRENRHKEVRLTGEQVHVELTKMLKRCKQEESYGCTPCPWKVPQPDRSDKELRLETSGGLPLTIE